MIGEHVGRIADQRLDAGIPDRPEGRRLEGLADQRRRVHLEVAAVQDPTRGRVDHEAGRLRNGMRHRHEAHGEGAGMGHMRPGVGLPHRAGVVARALHLALGKRRGEAPRIDRRLESRPEDAERAHVVLVAMGDEDRLQPVGAGLDPGRIGHDQLDARRRGHVREGHADVDEDEALGVLWPEAVEIHVHADLARAAERDVDQPILPGHVFRVTPCSCDR